MASKDKVLEELNFLTDKLSTQVRTTALGVLVFAWGLIVGESKTAHEIAEELRRQLVIVGSLAIFILLLDFLQYLAGYLNVVAVLGEMQRTAVSEAQYDETSYSFRLRKALFWAKIVALIVTVLWLLGALGLWMFHSADSSSLTPSQNLELRAAPVASPTP